MSALILDAGAFIAVDRDDPAMIARLRVANSAGLELRTTGIVVTEVWRDPGGRQSNLARLLKSVDVRSVDERLGRAAGALLDRAGRGHAPDATVVAIAATGDRIATSDPSDVTALVATSGHRISVIAC